MTRSHNAGSGGAHAELKIADRLIGTRSVKHGTCSATAEGKALAWLIRGSRLAEPGTVVYKVLQLP